MSGADNASYSVAASYDTVPMADQTGRIAVTLTNTGTSTWGAGYALGTQVFASGDTTGTGTPVTTGVNVPVSGSVAAGGTATVESVTPVEVPGSYEICWDMVNASGTYFAAEGGDEYCAAYTIAQYAPVINEQEPLPGTDEDSQTPSLSAGAVIPGGYPVNPSFTYAFEIINGPTPSSATVEQSSGWVTGNSNSWSPTTALTWGDTYYWVATVTDVASPTSAELSSATWTTPISFVVGDAQAGVASRLGPGYQAADGNPVMTSDLGGTDYSGSGKTVDPKTGNVSMQATDASVATVGPALSVVRTYNSLDPRTSQAFGAGWSSVADMSLVPDSDGSGALILTQADGGQVRFAKNSAGGYAPPDGFYAVVTALSGGGFSVTDQTGSTYDFAQASGTSWLISKITDESGMAETFTYSGATLTTISNTTSGRALHFTWSTPSGASYPHVASVSSDPVTAGQSGTALTWTYGYTGDLLTSVCSPISTTQCTTYSYITDGSHAPTSVMNADPTSYYRLDDPSGTTAAANQVPVNDLTAVNPPATEMNTTPGAAGPIPGAAATGFNGSSSWIPLDGVWCTTPGTQSSCSTGVGATGRVLGATATEALSIWFKTSTAGGTLLSADDGLPGTRTQVCAPTVLGENCTSNGSSPLLYITSSGDLASNDCTAGYQVTGPGLQLVCAPALASTAAVDNGAWHQAVLIPGVALYLDGQLVASASKSSEWEYSYAQSAVAMLGAGETTTCSNTTETCTSGNWSYFNGSLADFSVYQNQLPSAETVATQYAAETTPAAELAKITSPAGRTQFAATYDTVNDRVATITDTDGGTWTYGDPVNTASSGAYDTAVMGSAPEDFWPLNDSAGPDARDLVDDSATAETFQDPRPVATYSDVTLGVTGPTGFADGAAAGFSGTGSEISVPGGYWAGGGSGESAELWFDATKSTGQLLSTESGATGGEPVSLWLSGGTLEGSVGSTTLTSSKTVSTGTWYQAVITLAPSASGAATQAATLYLDGQSVATATVTTAAASSTGYTAYVGDGPEGDFTGSVADVSFYASGLPAGEAAAHYSALQAGSDVTSDVPSGVTAPDLNTQTATVTNPLSGTTRYMYSGGALVQATSPLGGVTRYGYDAAQRAVTLTDPDGDTTYTTYDAHNNVTSTTTCTEPGNCQTAYASYYEDLSNPLDPRNDKPTDDRDPRSSSPTDPAYDTVTTYTADGLIASTTTPPTTACPSGCVTANTYTTGSEAAVGGGTEPAGLLASVTTPDGGTATYAYDAAGDLMTATDPLGLVTRYTYDNLGRELSATQYSGTYPDGLTTSYTYDANGQVLTETSPPVTDRVTGAVHTEVTTNTYDPDGDVLTTTLSDSTGGDPSRTMTDTYNGYGELATVRDALGNTTSYTYDGLGDKLTVTPPDGPVTSYGYDAAGDLLTTTLDGYTGNPSAPVPAENLVEESRAYDPAGRLASVTNVMGTTTGYTYYGNNLLADSYVACASGTANCVSGMEDQHTYIYDAEGNQTLSISPGNLWVETTYNADDQATEQQEAGQTTTDTYDRDGNVTASSLTDGSTTENATATYNAMDQVMSSTVADGSTNLTTSYTRDERGLVTSVTDPDGDTTSYQNDELGNPVVQTLPAISSQTGSGGAAVTANPVYTTGYDTFGDVTESEDADGNITTAAYDQDGQQTSVTDPSYTAPGASIPDGGTTTYTYNNLGEQTSVTDPLGNKTQYTYDQLGDLASQTDADGGTWTYTYDPAGQQTSVTNPTGAQTQATYGNLGQEITSTQLVRQDTSAAYTTSYGYDDAGNQTSQTSPDGVTTTAAYNSLGQMTSSTDGAGNTTSYAYDLNGQLDKVTLPDGSGASATYDQAGNLTSEDQTGTTGNVLRTESAGYDSDGNMTSFTDPLGTTETATYDAAGDLTALTQPVTAAKNIQTSYGYDLDGNLTQQTDGNGNSTYTTYNSLGLPQVSTEPATAQYTSAADSATTDSYDADGDLIQQTQPGGVQINLSYDSMGRLLSQSGTGGTAATPTDSYTYNTAGRMLTAATTAAGTQGSPGYQPATSEQFSYDDRGLLLAAAGSAGASTFTYNGAGQLTSQAGPAGTSSYTYNSAGQLATDTDPASGATGTYSYNNLGQVTTISYGAGNDSQSYTYDPMHRLASDTISTAAGARVAAISYGYDSDDDITSMTTSGLATVGGGTGTVTSTYSYDLAGRLTSWTATPQTGTATTTSYGYDNDGNLTSSGNTTYAYDARDELTSDSNGNTYTYSPDGDLTAQQSATGTTTYTSDAYGQQVTDAGSSYAWDALDRVISADNGSSAISLTYSGATSQITSDSSATYSRDPSGAIVGINSTAGGQTLALNDEHQDLSGTFTAAGTALATSTTYDPWGQVIATSGPAPEIGYQGQWTDPATGQVNMGSRFYNPGKGSFLNQDTATPAGGNAYAYADDNPVTLTDLTGHSPDGDDTGTGQITQEQVDQAKAAADNAQKKAARLATEATNAKSTATHDLTALNAATSYATQMNNKAAQAYTAWTEAQTAAQDAYAAFSDFVQPFGGISGLQNDISNYQSDITYWRCQEAAASAGGGPGCVTLDDCVNYCNGSPELWQAEAEVDLYEGLLMQAQGLLKTAQGLQSTYQRLKSNAESLRKA
jgi:RHS repeat-associated protein